MSLLILCDFPPRVIQKGTKAQPLCMSHWVYWRVSISSFNYPTFTRYECPGGHVCVQRFRVQLSNYVSASSAKSWYPKGCFPPKTIKTIYSTPIKIQQNTFGSPLFLQRPCRVASKKMGPLQCGHTFDPIRSQEQYMPPARRNGWIDSGQEKKKMKLKLIWYTRSS